jgi:hypothetical protein
MTAYDLCIVTASRGDCLSQRRLVRLTPPAATYITEAVVTGLLGSVSYGGQVQPLLSVMVEFSERLRPDERDGIDKRTALSRDNA